MCGSSMSGAVHSLNSLNFFPFAKFLWGCGRRQHLPELEGRSQDSDTSALGLSVPDRPKMCDS